MDDVPNSSPASRWDEFRTRPFQNYAVTLLVLNSVVLAVSGLTEPGWIESMHVFSLVFPLQFLLVVGYFFARLYDARWYRILTVVYSVCAGLVAGLGWFVLLILVSGFP
jgi:hypothetical protein